MIVQQNYQTKTNFGAMAIKKPTLGQDAHQASQEIAKILGIDTASFHTPYGTVNGVLLKFKTPDAEIIAKENALAQKMNYVLLPDENINKRNAKNAINSVV